MWQQKFFFAHVHHREVFVIPSNRSAVGNQISKLYGFTLWTGLHRMSTINCFANLTVPIFWLGHISQHLNQRSNLLSELHFDVSQGDRRIFNGVMKPCRANHLLCSADCFHQECNLSTVKPVRFIRVLANLSLVRKLTQLYCLIDHGSTVGSSI